jgi:hypothetical protein
MVLGDGTRKRLKQVKDNKERKRQERKNNPDPKKRAQTWRTNHILAVSAVVLIFIKR